MNAITLDGKNIFPSKIVCIGRNYVDHIKELDNEIPDEPVIFLKPNSAISSDIHSNPSDLIHYEGEISFVTIAGELRGVGLGLDLTKRAVQSKLKAKGLPWERAKSFDRSAVFSPFVSFNGKVNDLRMALSINGDLRQQGGWDLMLNKPNHLLDEAKTFLSFEDGDVIMTGTPKGVGTIKGGDRFAGKIFLKDVLLTEGLWVVK